MINQLVQKIQKTKAPICVGLDPMLGYIPSHIVQNAFAEFKVTFNGSWDNALGNNGNNYVIDVAGATSVVIVADTEAKVAYNSVQHAEQIKTILGKFDIEWEPETEKDPVADVKVYFSKVTNWEKVYAYVWDKDGKQLNGAWPGVEIKKDV